MVYPSKAVFIQYFELTSSQIANLVESSFREVFSPKFTLEELIASLEACVQEKVNSDPVKYLNLEMSYGMKPETATLTISHPDNLNLSTIIDRKGKNLKYGCQVEFEEVHLIGFFDDKFLITNLNTNPWDDYADVIYIPRDSGFKLKKIKYFE